MAAPLVSGAYAFNYVLKTVPVEASFALVLFLSDIVHT